MRRVTVLLVKFAGVARLENLIVVLKVVGRRCCIELFKDTTKGYNH